MSIASSVARLRARLRTTWSTHPLRIVIPAVLVLGMALYVAPVPEFALPGISVPSAPDTPVVYGHSILWWVGMVLGAVLVLGIFFAVLRRLGFTAWASSKITAWRSRPKTAPASAPSSTPAPKAPAKASGGSFWWGILVGVGLVALFLYGYQGDWTMFGQNAWRELQPVVADITAIIMRNASAAEALVVALGGVVLLTGQDKKFSYEGWLAVFFLLTACYFLPYILFSFAHPNQPPDPATRYLWYFIAVVLVRFLHILGLFATLMLFFWVSVLT